MPGVTRADVTLADHHASAEINGGVAAQAGFVRSFAGSDQGEAVAELDELRLEFFRKAALAGQDRVARPLVDAGAGPDELAAMNLGAVPPSGDLSRMRQRREALGLPHGDDAPLLIHADGNRSPLGAGAAAPAAGAAAARRHRGQRRVLQVPAEDALRAREWLAVFSRG